MSVFIALMKKKRLNVTCKNTVSTERKPAEDVSYEWGRIKLVQKFNDWLVLTDDEEIRKSFGIAKLFKKKTVRKMQCNIYPPKSQWILTNFLKVGLETWSNTDVFLQTFTNSTIAFNMWATSKFLRKIRMKTKFRKIRFKFWATWKRTEPHLMGLCKWMTEVREREKVVGWL